jgi:uncharacterized protein YndB with AHSA1/START domain
MLSKGGEMEPAPIVHEYELRCTPQMAFTTYVERISEWWHPDYTDSPADFEAVTIEPRLGGAVTTSYGHAPPNAWGRVTVWDPPHRLDYAFTLGQTADHPSVVSVTFKPTNAGCQLRFEHGGWNDANASYRSKYSEWPFLLDRFVALANQEATGGPS